MKSKWVIHKLNSQRSSSSSSSSLSSLLLPHKTQFPHSSASKVPSSILNSVDVSLVLSLCGREGNLHLGSSIHASVIKTHGFSSQNVVIRNSLLSMYCKCGVLRNAGKVFDEMPLRDTISWNTLISGFLTAGEFEAGFGWFKRMLNSGLCGFDQATLTTILSACDGVDELGFFVNRMIHGLVFLSGFDKDISVGNALMTSYFKTGCCSSGKRVFDEMVERNVISWTAAISGLAQNEMYEESLRLVVEMLRGSIEPNFLTYLSGLMACSGLQAAREGSQIHGHVWKQGLQSELCIESALMDMYSKCGNVEDAWRVFESANQIDEVSMTVILVGFAQNGFEEEAIQFFVKMVNAGVEVDASMVSAALAAFGSSSSSLGQQIHSTIVKQRLDSNVFVCNGLINMYSKCGDLKKSMTIFNNMNCKNSVSWNSMIAAFARHGDFSTAMQLYEDMKLERVNPTDVTFLSLLHACGHGGMLEKGMELLNSMTSVHNLSPRTEHYACIVDMLGRAGLVKEAKAFVDELPIKPDVLIWQALLGGCGIHGDVEIGELAAEMLFKCEPNEPAPYVLLANIYSCNKMWKERAMAIRRMKEIRVSKEIGISWIEIEKKVHSFVVEDRMHPQGEEIYKGLMELLGNMVDEGYVPDKRWLLLLLRPKRVGARFLTNPSSSSIRWFSCLPSSCFTATDRTQEFFPRKGNGGITLTNQIVRSTLLNCSSDLISLGLFIWSARQPNHFHDREEFDVMVGVVWRLTSRYRTVNAIVKELESIGLSTKAGTFLLLLRVYWCGGMYPMVLETYYEMDCFGFTPNTFARNVIMDIVFRLGNKDFGMKVLKEVPLPNFLSYNIALCHVCKSNDLVLVRDVLCRMVRRGYYPSSQTFELVLNCFCRERNLSGAFQVFGLMTSLGVPLSVTIWTMLIDGFFRLGEPNMAGFLFSKMVETGCSPSIVTYTVLFRGYMESGMVDKAFSILNESEGYEHDLFFCNVRMRSLVKIGQDGDARFVFDSMRKSNMVPDSFTICSLLSARCNSKVLILWLKLLIRFVVLDNLVLYNSLMHFCCDAGYPFLAEWLYHDMIEKGFRPDNYSFIGLLRGIFGQGRSSEAVGVYSGLLMDRHNLDAHVHTAVLHCLIQSGNLSKAMDLFRKAVIQNFPLDVVSYTVVINGLLENGRQEAALDLYEQMKAANVCPTAHLCRVMLRRVCLIRDPKRIQKLMEDIAEAEVQLDYDSLVRLTDFLEYFASTSSLNHLNRLWNIVLQDNAMHAHSLDEECFDAAKSAALLPTPAGSVALFLALVQSLGQVGQDSNAC
ncbi:Pentatricopeptide repeat-containing protein At3g05340 [Linum perenne]